ASVCAAPSVVSDRASKPETNSLRCISDLLEREASMEGGATVRDVARRKRAPTLGLRERGHAPDTYADRVRGANGPVAARRAASAGLDARRLPAPGRHHFRLQQVLPAPVARREVEGHDLARAQPAGDLARLARGEVVLAQRMVALGIGEDRFDVEHV